MSTMSTGTRAKNSASNTGSEEDTHLGLVEDEEKVHGILTDARTAHAHPHRGARDRALAVSDLHFEAVVALS